MSLNGQLNIMLHLAKQDEQFILNDIEIDLVRPNIAQKMLIGQSPQQAVQRISQLMTVCHHAQTAAAKLALGYQLANDEIRAIAYENIEQGLWRLVIDLPKSLGIELSLQNFIALRKVINQHDHNNIIIFAKKLFMQLCQIDSQTFISLTVEQFESWLTSVDSPMTTCLRKVKQDTKTVVNKKNVDYSMLSPYPNNALLEKVGKYLLAEDYYCQKPHLDNTSYETGSLSTTASHPLARTFTDLGVAGRLASRLLYVAQKINELEAEISIRNVFGRYSPSTSLQGNSCEKQDGVDDGSQLAWVQTARGLLIHMASIQQGKISQYSIIAPTEWNFHPEGALAKILINSIYNSQHAARESARSAVLALDPCIEFNLGVAYA